MTIRETIGDHPQFSLWWSPFLLLKNLLQVILLLVLLPLQKNQGKSMGMKKLEVSGTLITLDMFKCSVIVLAAKSADTVIKGLSDLWKANEWNTKDLPEIKKLIKGACDNHDHFKGITIPDEVDCFIVYLEDNLSKVSEEVIVHECFHAMRFICARHGVEDEETQAYMLEYLFSQTLDAQDAYVKQKKKLSKCR